MEVWASGGQFPFSGGWWPIVGRWSGRVVGPRNSPAAGMSWASCVWQSPGYLVDVSATNGGAGKGTLGQKNCLF